MKDWFKQHKWKIVVPILICSVLATAFWYGGGAPGLQGWSVSVPDTTVSETQTLSDNPETASSTESPTETPTAPAETNTGAENTEPAATETQKPAEAESPETTEGRESEVGSDIASRPGGTEGNMSAGNKVAAAQEIAGQTGSSAGVEQGDKSYSEQQGMQIDEKTGKDQYQTDPVPGGKPIPVEPQDAVITDKECTCTLSISCDTINDNLSWLDPEKVELVPEDGWILKSTQVTFYEGESVFNVLLRTCKQQGIHMEYENTPIYNSAYIEGIHNLYQFDCGELSGWMYKVNGWFPNYGCSRYQLQDGDSVEWVYTCNLGVDVGGYYSTSG